MIHIKSLDMQRKRKKKDNEQLNCHAREETKKHNVTHTKNTDRMHTLNVVGASDRIWVSSLTFRQNVWNKHETRLLARAVHTYFK